MKTAQGSTAIAVKTLRAADSVVQNPKSTCPMRGVQSARGSSDLSGTVWPSCLGYDIRPRVMAALIRHLDDAGFMHEALFTIAYSL